MNSFIRDPSAVIGAVLMVLFVFCAVFAPMPPIMVLMAVDLAVVIMLEATLSFLGVGVPHHRAFPGHDDCDRQKLYLCRHVVDGGLSRCYPDPSSGGHQSVFRLVPG